MNRIVPSLPSFWINDAFQPLQVVIVCVSAFPSNLPSEVHVLAERPSNPPTKQGVNSTSMVSARLHHR